MESIAVDDVNMEWDTGLDGDSAINFWNFGEWNTTENGAPSLSDMDFSWNLHSLDASGQFQSSMGTDHEPGEKDAMTFHEEPLSPIPTTRSGSEPALLALPMNKNRKRNRTNDTLENMTSVTAQSRVPSQSHHQTEPSITFTPISLGEPNPPSKSSKTSLSISNSNGSLRATGLGVPSPSRPSLRSMAIETNGLFGVEEITNVICDYPKRMLRPNFWSPFVHHRHYRCSQGGLAEPIAVALCCVSASLQSVESSVPFVCRMINDERENLINDFPMKSENLEDAIAVLHAMCIYQIETILRIRSQKPINQRVSSTELYHHFLLKMTRRLCQQHIEGVSLMDNTAISWHCWTMAETLRRTTFLVHMVNELSYHTNALNGVYYESLHEALLLDMPLPAPESMWRALNEGEWAAARDTTGWTGPGVLTLRTSMDRLDARARVLGGSPERAGRSLDNIQHISKLIISSVRHFRRE